MMNHTAKHTKHVRKVVQRNNRILVTLNAISRRRQDPLERRLRRMAREIISQSRRKNEKLKCITILSNKELPIYLRTLWVFIVIFCLTATSYQVSDRINYYRSIPIAVDVSVTDEAEFDIGLLTFCGQETMPLKNAVSKQNAKAPETYQCFNHALHYMDQTVTNNTDELWSLMNTSHLFKSASFIATNGVSSEVRYTASNSAMTPCVTIEHRKNITMGSQLIMSFRRPVGACLTSALWLLLHPRDAHPETRRCIGVLFGAEIKCGFKGVQYIFVDRRGNRCGTVQDYSDCIKNCHQKLYKKRLFCRFPFMNRDSNMPACNLSSSTRDQYVKACQVAYSADPYKDCNCTRPCIRSDNEVYIETVSMGGNETIVQAHTSDRKMTTYRERIDYDFTALVCDVGGNIGLYLGLSIASVIDILCSAFMKRKTSKSSFSVYDPLYQKVKRVYDKQQKSSNVAMTIQLCVRNRTSFAINSLKLVVYFVSFLASAYLVYQRIEYYLQVPLKVVVDVSEYNTIQLPKIAICGITSQILQQKRKVMKKEKRFSSMCDVELLDILDLKKYDIDELWRRTSIKSLFDENIDIIAESVIGKMYLKNITASEVPTPHGTCIQYSSGPQPYIGSMTAFSAFSLRPNADADCGRYYRTVYMSLIDSDHDFSSVNQLASQALVYVYFQSRKIQRINSTKDPCVDSKIFFDCKRRCFNEKLKDIVSCRLPYMTSLNDLRACTTSGEAKASNFAYLNLSSTLNAERDCKCYRQCEEVIYVISTHVETMEIGVTAFVFSYAYNIVPTMREAYVYSLAKLISDIGSIAGLLLSFSLLESAHLLISIMQTYCSDKFT